MEDFEKLKKYNSYIPVPDLQEHQGDIPENAGEYKDPTKSVNLMKRLDEIEKKRKDIIKEMFRLKELIAAGGRKIESPQDLEDDLKKATETLEILQAEEDEIRRNLPEMN